MVLGVPVGIVVSRDKSLADDHGVFFGDIVKNSLEDNMGLKSSGSDGSIGNSNGLGLLLANKLDGAILGVGKELGFTGLDLVAEGFFESLDLALGGSIVVLLL